MSLWRHTTGEDGASLLIVLVFMLLISVITMGTLAFTQASFQTTGSVRDARQQTYAADAALELAIRKVADDPTGALGAHGSGSTCAFDLANVNGYAATVTCSADGTAGASTGTPARNAILTLAAGGGAGNHADNLKLTGNFDYVIDGSIWSNSGIDKQTSSNTINATAVMARRSQTSGPHADSCFDTKLIGSNGKYCGAAAAPPDPAQGDDPAWAPNTGTTTAPTSTPYCTGTSPHVQVFSPGMYTASPADLRTGACASDSSAVLYFKPGRYYFVGSASAPLVFETDRHDVVAGTAGTWFGDGSAPTSPPTDGSACSATAAGAQFVFGGRSRLVISNRTTTFTLCAPAPALSTQPPVAIYAIGSVTGLASVDADSLVVKSHTAPAVFVHGAVYAPTSNLEVVLHQRGQTLFSGGIIAKRLTLDVSASTTQATSPIVVPSCSGTCRTKRRVLFTATAGSKTIRAVVQFNDTNAPSANYSIESWTVLP